MDYPVDCIMTLVKHFEPREFTTEWNRQGSLVDTAHDVTSGFS